MLFAFAVFVGTASAPATEFPLELKRLSAREALVCRNCRVAGRLEVRKPREIATMPKAVSKYPLYGLVWIPDDHYPIPFRLDESDGTGKGYDRLIIDLNRNGDLGDDSLAKATKKGSLRDPRASEISVFGPIAVPEGDSAGPWRGRVCAEMRLYERQAIATATEWTFIGELRLASNAYFEATVNLGGVTQKIGFLDANYNTRVGDKPKVHIYKRNGNSYPYFHSGDAILRDRDGSGQFDLDLCESGVEPFSDVIYIGPNPYTLTIAKDLKSVRFEPYSGPLGELAVIGRLDGIRTLALARQGGRGQWTPVTPGFVNGKTQLPVGAYCLRTCVVVGDSSDGTPIMSRGSRQSTKELLKVAAGKTVRVRAGPPLELQLEAKTLVAPSAGSSTVNTRQVDISARIVGTGGEIYVLHTTGKDLSVYVKPPRFGIFDDQGQELASGQLEFG